MGGENTPLFHFWLLEIPSSNTLGTANNHIAHRHGKIIGNNTRYSARVI